MHKILLIGELKGLAPKVKDLNPGGTEYIKRSGLLEGEDGCIYIDANAYLLERSELVHQLNSGILNNSDIIAVTVSDDRESVEIGMSRSLMVEYLSEVRFDEENGEEISDEDVLPVTNVNENNILPQHI